MYIAELPQTSCFQSLPVSLFPDKVTFNMVTESRSCFEFEEADAGLRQMRPGSAEAPSQHWLVYIGVFIPDGIYRSTHLFLMNHRDSSHCQMRFECHG